jgi:DNA-binding NarL/FixJ family response regulator
MQAAPIRILLANHLPIIRSGLRFLLDRDPAEAANGREALVLTDYKHPDVVLLEIMLPLVSGIDVARQIASGKSGVCPVFVTDLTDKSYVQEAFKAGALGYVAGDSASADLPRAVRLVAKGQFYLSPSICSQFLQEDLAKGNITEYDRDLWCLIVSGYEQREITQMLQTSGARIEENLRSLRNLFCRNALPDALGEIASFGTNRATSSPRKS